jgi:HEAT repeat protein
MKLDEVQKMAEANDIDGLIRALKDPDRWVRQEATTLLGIKRAQRALLALIETLNDENSSVRANAAWALGRLGNKDAIEPLKQAIEKEPFKAIQEIIQESIEKIIG